MKKILSILVLLTLALSAMAQRSGSTTGIPPLGSNNANRATLTMTAADSVAVSTTSYWLFDVNRPKPYYFVFSVKMDSSRAAANANHYYVDVQGSLDGTNFIATTATQVKYGSTVDSTFYLGDIATGVLWRYLKLKVTAQATAVKGARVTAISVKVADKY